MLEDLMMKKDISTKKILDIIGVGKAELNNIQDSYYGTASDFSEKGFGSFDLCLHIISLTDGNAKQAEKLLSKLQLREAKYMT
jgi:hypothetical protein